MEDPDKILLTYLNGTGYVFDPDDYMTLRRQHRIVGNLVGTTSTRGFAPTERTLPIELRPHELQLLLAKNIALLVSKQQGLLQAPSEDELRTYQRQHSERVDAQRSARLNEKLREVERNMDKVLRGKRRKKVANGETTKDVEVSAADILREAATKFSFNAEQAIIQIPCAHLEPHPVTIVEHPPMEDTLKYRVFRHFWEQGFYVTPGDAFGGDFLIYPADPLICHASHIVILLDGPDALMGSSLAAKVRLAVTVNKLCVFAYCARHLHGSGAKQGEDIAFMSFQWEGAIDLMQTNQREHCGAAGASS